MDRETISTSLADGIERDIAGIGGEAAVTCVILDSGRDDLDGPFALIAIDLPPALTTKETLVGISRRAFAVILSSDHVDDLGGAELIFRLHSTLLRVCRVSVTREGFRRVLDLQPDDLTERGRLPGVGCWMYDEHLR